MEPKPCRNIYTPAKKRQVLGRPVLSWRQAIAFELKIQMQRSATEGDKFCDTGADWMVTGMCAIERGGEGLKHIYSCVKYFKIEVRLEILAEAELSVLHILKVKF